LGFIEALVCTVGLIHNTVNIFYPQNCKQGRHAGIDAIIIFFFNI